MTLVLALPACGGSSSGGSSPTPPVTCGFTSSNAAAAADLVRFTDTVVVASNLCTVQVAIGGATTDSNYYAFAFDVEISDSTVAQFVSGSDTAGNFLTGTVDAQATQSGSRVVVGVSKSGQVAGNGTANAEDLVVSLTFRVLKAGTATLSFQGSPQNPALQNCSATGPEAIADDTGNWGCIASTNFGTGGTITGS
jgi:hypothetical protein